MAYMNRETAYVQAVPNTHHDIRMLILALTGACNFRCTYCYASAQPPEKIPRAALRWALDLAGQSGQPFVVQFTGGEPLLAFERLVYAVDYIREKKYPATLQIQTNASLLTPTMARYFAAEKIGVGVSLDGSVAANDAARQYPDRSGTAADIMRGLQVLAQAGVAVGMTCVVGAHNIHALSSVVDMAYYAGNVRKLGFDLLRPQGRASRDAVVTEAEMAVALEQVMRRADELERLTGRHLIFVHGQRVAQLQSGRTEVFAHCYAMTHHAVFVNPRGECYSCASLSAYPQYRIGSYREGLRGQATRAAAADIKQAMERCYHCEFLEKCGGGCYARWAGGDTAHEAECRLKQMFINRYEKQRGGLR